MFLHDGKLFRALSHTAQVKSSHYSRKLQRAIVDFGIDSSFDQAVKKLKEHYKIEIPKSAVLNIVSNHFLK